MFSAPVFAQSNAGEAKLGTEIDSVSYALGINLGVDISNSLKESNVYLSEELFAKGFLHGLKDSGAVLSADEIDALLTMFQVKRQQLLQEQSEVTATENREAGAAFLMRNRTQEGVKETASGLQYKVINKGRGTKPGPGSSVTVHYKGMFLNGEVFDNSYERGEPSVFRLDEVIKGWTEGLQLMSKGAEFILYIPADLAYGDQVNDIVAPGSLLIFEIKLIDVQK